jgi:hypothetical protein
MRKNISDFQEFFFLSPSPTVNTVRPKVVQKAMEGRNYKILTKGRRELIWFLFYLALNVEKLNFLSI